MGVTIGMRQGKFYLKKIDGFNEKTTESIQ
jgi:hypothetical protein